MRQLRRPYKSLSANCCILCGSGESINYFFLHCLITLGLWHKLFNLTKIDWIPPRNIGNMMTISFKWLGKISCPITAWIMWWERNARIFEGKWRMVETLWGLLHFYSSLSTSCTIAFKGSSLNVINLIGIWFVIQKGWAIMREALFGFDI